MASADSLCQRPVTRVAKAVKRLPCARPRNRWPTSDGIIPEYPKDLCARLRAFPAFFRLRTVDRARLPHSSEDSTGVPSSDVLNLGYVPTFQNTVPSCRLIVCHLHTTCSYDHVRFRLEHSHWLASICNHDPFQKTGRSLFCLFDRPRPMRSISSIHAD